MKKILGFCVCLGWFLTALSAFAQFAEDAEIESLFLNDLQVTENQMNEYGEKVANLYQEMMTQSTAKVMKKIEKQVKSGGKIPSQEEAAKFAAEIMIDETFAMRKNIRAAAVKIFSEETYQKMQIRDFQIREGIVQQLSESDSQELIFAEIETETAQLITGMPNFLELHPEQEELITQLQKENSLATSSAMTEEMLKFMTNNPQKFAEMQKLIQQILETDDETELEKLEEKFQEIYNESVKPLLPKMKKIILDGHESFMRVLNDSQKAKVKQVLSETPKYLLDQ